MNYDIHTGQLLGLAGKILAFLASLIAASLPITGFYIWWGRKKKKHKMKLSERKLHPSLQLQED
ncbi:MAG: PepSY-associated TM helix domain-containing protein [Ginsengibacter sp.]